MSKDKNQPTEKEADLAQKETELTQKETELVQKEAELTQKETDLQLLENQLNEKKAVLEAFDLALKKREAELLERENALKTSFKNEKKSTEKNTPKSVVFSFRGEKYRFVDEAPATILFEGFAKTQEEIAQDEEALVILIGGNSSLIEKI